MSKISYINDLMDNWPNNIYIKVVNIDNLILYLVAPYLFVRNFMVCKIVNNNS